MPGPWEQILKTAQDEWPKALIGLAVPASQFAWTYCNGRRLERRQSDLRKKISELDQFLHAKLPNNSQGERIRSDAQSEYEKSVAELALLSHVRPIEESGALPAPAATEAGAAAAQPTQAASVPETAARPSQIRNILRLYAPTSVKGWIVQCLYFLFLATSLLVGFATAMEIDGSDFGPMVGAFAFYAVPTFGFWYWSGRILRTKMVAATAPKAKGKSAWLPITLIVISAIMEYGVIMGCALDDQDNFSADALKANWGGLLGGSIFFGAAIVLCVLWKRRIRSRTIGPSMAGAR